MSHPDQLMCGRVREHKLLYNCKPFNATSPQWLPLASRIKASTLCEWVNSWIYQDMDSPTVACVFVLLAAGDTRDGGLANMSWDKCITNGRWDERKKETDRAKSEFSSLFSYSALGFNASFMLRSESASRQEFNMLCFNTSFIRHCDLHMKSAILTGC